MKLGLSNTLITSEPCLASRSFEALNWEPGIRQKASLEKRRSNRRLLSSRSHRSLLESSPDGIITGLDNSTGTSSRAGFNSNTFLNEGKLPTWTLETSFTFRLD